MRFFLVIVLALAGCQGVESSTELDDWDDAGVGDLDDVESDTGTELSTDSETDSGEEDTGVEPDIGEVDTGVDPDTGDEDTGVSSKYRTCLASERCLPKWMCDTVPGVVVSDEQCDNGAAHPAFCCNTEIDTDTGADTDTGYHVCEGGDRCINKYACLALSGTFDYGGECDNEAAQAGFCCDLGEAEDTDSDTGPEPDTDTGPEPDTDTGPNPCEGGVIWGDWCVTLESFNNLVAGPTQVDAMVYCSELRLGGYKDWRLPAVNNFRDMFGDCEQSEFHDNYAVVCGDCASNEKCAELFPGTLSDDHVRTKVVLNNGYMSHFGNYSLISRVAWDILAGSPTVVTKCVRPLN